MMDAALWRPGKDGAVHCELCNHFCTVAPGARGKCGVRENRGGRLMSLVADRVAAINMDPIEKKPLYHFLPGSTSLSIGTMGCNMSCSFCQNHALSMPPKDGRPVSESWGQAITPAQLVTLAKDYGAASISYTYNEPTVFFELVEPTARLAADKGLKNVLVSNGFMSAACLKRLEGPIHAANVDLKAFSDDFYRDLCQARLQPVLDNLRAIKAMGWWLEVTTLLIPGLNDSDAELQALAGFIHDELGPETPWHVSRFHPTYRLTDRGPTPPERLKAALVIGTTAKLRHVYVGNLPTLEGQNTLCPSCGCTCLDRSGFTVRHNGTNQGACPTCGQGLAGVWR